MRFVILTLFFLFTYFLFQPEIAWAQVCGGTFSCTSTVQTCSPSGCFPGEPGCICSDVCTGAVQGGFACQNVGGSCQAPWWACQELCGAPINATCAFISAPTPTSAPQATPTTGPSHQCFVNSDCGANRECCAAAGGNVCTAACYACNGNYICAPPTATPTPTTPPPPCSSPRQCQGGSCVSGWTQVSGACSAGTVCCSQNPTSPPTCASPNQCQGGSCVSGWSPASGTCSTGAVCCRQNATPTPTRTPTPTPTQVAGCGSCTAWQTTGACGSGGCPSGSVYQVRSCPSGSSCPTSQCASSASCNPTATPTPGSTCVPNGGSCSAGDCCSGYCRTATWSCQNPPAPTSPPNPTATPTPAPDSCYDYFYCNHTDPTRICSGYACFPSGVGGEFCGSCPSGQVCDNSAGCVDTPPPTPTDRPPATPTPVSSTIGGTVFHDENGDRNQGGFEPGMGGVTVRLTGTNGYSQTRTSSAPFLFFPGGDYTFSNVPNGVGVTYTLRLDPVPAGYVVTRPGGAGAYVMTSSGSINNTTRNFGLYDAPIPTNTPTPTESPLPSCAAPGITVSGCTGGTCTVEPGDSTTLSVSCTGEEDPDDGNPPPPYTWDPDTTNNNPPSTVSTGGGGSGGLPECSDGGDNDGDGLSDEEDPGCHSDNDTDTDNDGIPDATDPDDDNDGIPDTSDPDDDGDGIPDTSDPTWPDSYDPNDDSESGGGGSGGLPECADGDDNDGDGLSDAADPGCHTDDDPSNPDSYNPNDDSEDGGGNGPTTIWIAPVCPSSTQVHTPQVTVSGSGGSTSYITSITVPGTNTVTTNVREVTDSSECTTTSGTAYTGGNVNITGGIGGGGGGSVNTTQTTDTNGTTTFACIPPGSYQVTLAVPSGYDVVGRTVTPGSSSNSGSNGIRFDTGPSRTATFCILKNQPWFQTNFGNVRFTNLVNQLPTGKFSSVGENTTQPQNSAYPGIFYSSSSTANFGNGEASSRNWVIDNEYSYNANTQNRNGGMSYDFYKSKARQDGVAITPISSGTLNPTEITGSGVYEANADLAINSYTHVNGRRVVLLVDGNVRITDPSITIPLNQGLLIVAAKGDITFSSTVGSTNPAAVYSIGGANTFDGYYTAQGNIILEGGGCPDGTTPDRKLNIGGALIANALKPFASNFTGGKVVNNRSLCDDSAVYPSLFVSTRPDFLLQMTDFYKTSYSKWREVNP